MPELPEVETVMRGLAPVMEGHVISRLECRRRDLRYPLPERFAAQVAGRRITALRRRAKYLVAEIDGCDVLLMHLGMSGRFTIAGDTIGTYVHSVGGDPRHDHVVFHIEGGTTVTYNDPRRFGFMLLVPAHDFDSHPLMRGLGVEPLGNGLHADYLAELAQGRRADLKSFLLDQRNVAGLGNIYVSESLHRAGISPLRAASCLSTTVGKPTDRCRRLVPAIRDVLQAAIDAGGSTLRDYKQADGALGYFQHQFLVYDRAGEPCLREGCKGIVRRTIQAGRSTFHCPSCQR